MHGKRILSIIPARSGSKSIKKKNLKILAGKPLIEHTIIASLHSKKRLKTVVSSNSKEILKISKKAGAEVMKRPSSLAKDNSPTERAIAHVLKELAKKGYVPDAVILLQPTSPLRTSSHIDKALNVFFEKNYDSLLSVCEDHSFLWKKAGKFYSPINYNAKNRPMRQKMRQYKENGAIYIFSTKAFNKHNSRICGKTGIYIMDKYSSIDIDEEEDIVLCENILRMNGMI